MVYMANLIANCYLLTHPADTEQHSFIWSRVPVQLQIKHYWIRMHHSLVANVVGLLLGRWCTVGSSGVSLLLPAIIVK